MCHVGEFNLSQASLTSPAALTALWQLANTNTTLYHEITGGNCKGNLTDLRRILHLSLAKGNPK
jgi:hypothetical protein